ncbi:MAG: LysR family transcriptional regulator [Oscillospiraceae bacterium]|nr:LysR family transcriptional regulator [Oscillospiraceae bacterium]MBQ7341596.1 LysR family transcriptional regulator [Oscillospiraceae bacterium]
MNYNYLRYFSVLAQVEHYTLAAARLEISQPSLSSAIHHLEDELGGIKLFEKVGRNVRLTEEGRFFREQVDAALQKLNNATMTLQESRVSAPVVIKLGLVSGTLDGAVAREITQYAAENDRIRFQITESSADELMDLVRQEKLDMAVVDTTNRDRTLHFRKLYQQNYCVALPSDHPLAAEEQIAPARLRQERQVVFNRETENSFGQWASGAVAAENTVCSVNTAQAALDLVAAGAGVCLVPESCVRRIENVSFVPVENRHQALYMCILYDKWLEPPIWEFVEKLVKVLRNQSL